MMNNNEKSTLKSFATSVPVMLAIGLAVGYAVFKMGLVQKITGKLFSKKDAE